jgi:hypothetical protein
VLRAAKEALTRGEVSFVSEQVSELLATFRVNLDPSSRAYRQLGLVVLKRYVRALQAISQRNQGEVVDTPRAVEPTHCEPATGGTISAALAGWRRQKQTTAMTLREFEHAVQRCKELHGDLPREALVRHHVREFREALQAIPGKLSVFQRMSVSA